MSTPLLAPLVTDVVPGLVPLLEEGGAGPWPYLIAALALAILLGLMLGLLAFGKGREHS